MAGIINPRFSASEMAIIDDLIKSGTARSRADFVRKSTLKAIWEMENNQKGREEDIRQ